MTLLHLRKEEENLLSFDSVSLQSVVPVYRPVVESEVPDGYWGSSMSGVIMIVVVVNDSRVTPGGLPPRQS